MGTMISELFVSFVCFWNDLTNRSQRLWRKEQLHESQKKGWTGKLGPLATELATCVAELVSGRPPPPVVQIQPIAAMPG